MAADPDILLREDRLPIGTAGDLEWASDVLVVVDGNATSERLGTALANAGMSGGSGNPGVELVFQNGGLAIATGQQGDLEVQSDCTLSFVTMVADQAGSAVVDIWKCTFAQFDDSSHPVAGDTITGGVFPTITAGVKYHNATLTNWNRVFNKGDILRIHVNSAATITQLTVSLGFVTQGAAGGGVQSIIAGSNVTVTGTPQNPIVNATPGAGGVTQIIAGTNVTISPSSGFGAVTVNSSGGGGGGLPSATALNQFLVPTNTGGTAAWANASVNLMNPAFGSVGSIGARAVAQAGLDYLFSIGFYEAYWPNAAGGGYNIDGPVYLDPPPNLRSGISLANQKLAVFAAPSIFGKGMSLTFAPQTIITANDGVTPYWQTAAMLVIGTQNTNRVYNGFFVGPAQNIPTGNRQIDPRCTTILIASGNGGATDTIIENVSSRGTYRFSSTGQNGPSALAEHNRWNNCTSFAAICIDLINDQALVNQVNNGAHAGDLYCFLSRTGQDLTINGGEHGGQTTTGATVSGTLTATSALIPFTDTLPGGQTFTNYRFTFSGTGNPLLDGTFYYNAWVVNLPSFGQVPCAITSAAGGTATVTLDQGWVWQNYAHAGIALDSGTDFNTELAAIPSLIQGQRSWVFAGNIHVTGRPHIETNKCVALYTTGPANPNNCRFVVDNPDFGNWQPGGGTDANTAQLNRHHPWIKATGHDVILNDWRVAPDGESNGPPIVIQFAEVSDDELYTQFVARDCSWLSNTNHRYVGKADHAPPPVAGPGYDTTMASQAMIGSNAAGFGRWSRSGWSRKDVNTLSLGQMQGRSGTGMTEFWGYLPARSQESRITTADVALLAAGSASAPQVCGGRLIKVEQIGTTAASGGPATSGIQTITHVIDTGGNGYSYWGNVALNWTMKGQTNCVNISGGTITQFFNGCEIGLTPDDASLPVQWFMVNACHYNDNGTSGYILVHGEGTHPVLNGTKTVTYTGSTIQMRKPVLKCFPGLANHGVEAGAAAGNIAVTGIKVGDALNEVFEYTAGAFTADLTSEFSITATDTINNTGGTDTTGKTLIVRWTKFTP